MLKKICGAHLDRYPTSPDPAPLAAEHPPSPPAATADPPHPRFPYSTAAADPPHPAHRLIKNKYQTAF